MKIFKTEMTARLPKIISECRDRVFIVFEDGKKYPVNENEATMKMFEKFWENSGYSQVELICESVTDNSRLCKMLFSYI